MPLFKLDGTELKIAKALAQKGDNITVGKLGGALGLHTSQVSRSVNSLAEKGVLSISRLGVSKKVGFSDTKHADLLRRLMAELAPLNPEKILGSSYLEVLSCLSFRKADTNDLLSETGLAVRTVRPILKELRQRGIVLKNKEGDGTYQISSRFSSIKEFVMEFRRYCNRKKALEMYSDTIVVWEQNREFIIRSSSAEEKEAEGFLQTGISAFHKYGVQLLVPDIYYYFYSPKNKNRKGGEEVLRLEDIITHTVLIDEAPSPRIMMAVLLLWKKNERSIDTNYLSLVSNRYGKLEIIRKIERYLSTEGIGEERPEGFPKWDEFLSKSKEYGL